jgi:hypothetical protein
MVQYNKRNFFRVELIMPVKWQILNADETEIVKKGGGGSLLTQNLFRSEMPQDMLSNMKDDHVSRSFQTLNNKLNFIIKSLLDGSNPPPVNDRIVEISASGLKFRTNENLGPDTLLKTNLIFPEPPYLQIELIAETMRVQQLDNGYLVAANIICIDDDARDFLIKMIFQKQRIDIQRIKTGMEAGGNDSTVK